MAIIVYGRLKQILLKDALKTLLIKEIKLTQLIRNRSVHFERSLRMKRENELSKN